MDDTPVTTENLEDSISDAIDAGAPESADGSADEFEFDLPEHWADKDKDEFKAIRDAKAALAFTERRYGEMDSGFQARSRELSDKAKTHDVLREVFQPYEADFGPSGLDVVGGIRRLAAVHGALKEDPAAALSQLVQMYGLNPQSLIQELASRHNVDLLDIDMDDAYASGPQTTPELQLMQQQMQQLMSEMQTDRETAIRREMETFADEVDADGTRLRPHFDDVIEDMQKLVQAGIATGFADAYEKALALRPDAGGGDASPFVRSKSDAVRKAKRAAENAIDGNPAAAGGSDSAPTSIEATLRAAMDAA